MTTKIASWNVNSLKVRLPHVLEWLEKEKPDILALQETKLTDENFPKAEIEAAGYHVVFSGQKTYNGVAILSKAKFSKEVATDIITDVPELSDPQRRILAATVSDIRIINLYVPNGEAVESEKYSYKLQWLAHLTQFIAAQLKQYKKVAVLGDFNVAPTDADVRHPERWEGKVLCSAPERAAFQALLDTGLKDSFRLFEQPERSYSWWDYRLQAFQRDWGLRIDHILVSETLAKACKSSWIDKEPRKAERPSDHTPVVAEFAC